ncbi:uncharacterized protein BX664DRAFT_271635 [Halteromyces radiatus]|uniref:uncharacterized protein n=1 Tax=Halteromyces radiatus TaxID=101107 RepID=UPI00221E9FB8|nr:uncharacterized protein BX664DRAFT_271635 [Halteromyces radiatus]KAI8098800.1 hypothetical protein BX664DRAFT_271635 [Halteromyces radiatus]
MNTNISPNHPPYPAYRATEKGSFAWDSTVRRWPIIIDTALVDMQKAMDTLQNDQVTQKEEGTSIINGLNQLKQEIADDKPLRLLKDNDSDSETWNQHITTHFNNVTWFNGSWLFNECYMYRRIRELYSLSNYWQDYDLFNNQKIATFRGSHGSVFDLATKMPTMIQPMEIEKQELVFQELLQVCLWGNATDLSLLTNMTEDDIKRLQAIEKEKLAEQLNYIVVNHIDQVWKKLKHLEKGRVDFILDNSGFEVFVDLIFADWLLQTNRASKVVFNCKTIPWFVSDVMPKDIPILFDCCLNPDFFPGEPTKEQQQALETLVKRWQSYVHSGQLVIQSHSFWCNGLAYRTLRDEAPELYQDLATSDLIIFKGDLNFRKLVYDCQWPVTTPFHVAIGPSLAEGFTSILSLRTNKADTIVGLADGKQEKIEATATPNEWRCSGKYAVVAYNEGSS